MVLIGEPSQADLEGLGVFKRVEKQLFTGLHDKNGKEIWEGDIISPDFEVKWDSFKGNWFASTRNNRILYLQGDCFKESRVIGNIYENKELLKGDK